ncbi:hypothetical protein WDU94_010185 [Cyamophila willieti]
MGLNTLNSPIAAGQLIPNSSGNDSDKVQQMKSRKRNERSMQRIMFPLGIIFDLGLHDLDLAQTGVSVLTTWYSILPRDTSRELIQPLVPLLNNYLTSRDSEQDAVHYTEAEWDILLSKSAGHRSKLAQMKKRQFIESCEQTSQLRQLQTSIIYFLSMLESNLARQIVRRDGNRGSLSEVTSHRLLFNVPFLTMKVPIYLDIFLDRLISLASSSSKED